eukprot:g4179.t1 g4179   contig15:506165-507238(-)
MRNFLCYVDAEMMDGDNVGSTKICRENKLITKPECIEARYQASWHNGWKDHMLKGRLIGMFLVNVLDEALFELGRLQSLLGHDEAVILSRLQQSEEHDSHSFRQQPPDVDVWRENTSKDMDSVTKLRGESICHIALLPSRSRLEGITTQSKQQCELLEVDHKDFFLVREQDGWVHTIVPNDRELQLYQRTTPVQGIIVLCTRICPMNTCRDIHVNLYEVKRRTKLFITVDGSPVINVQKLDGCNILESDDGIRWGNKDQFELRFRINAPGTLHMLKISPMIVF